MTEPIGYLLLAAGIWLMLGLAVWLYKQGENGESNNAKNNYQAGGIRDRLTRSND